MARNGIFCLEGDWEPGLRRTRSLLPVLNLVQSQWGVPFIHRTASTREEFRRAIEHWSKSQYSRYPILYLGFHGNPGVLQIGDESIPILDLFEFQDRGRGRVLHFSSCATLNVSRAQVLKFLKRTRFAAVSGFKKEVDWLHSSALEILILDEFSQRKISPQNLERAHKKLLKLARTLVRSMEFGLFTRSSL